MRNYKLTIAYDGTRYNGWQRQSQSTSARTIQGILEGEISKILGYKVTIDGSGRTDGGVHAKGQVANVNTAGALDPKKFQLELNEVLPEDIRIQDVMLVKNQFHSRYSAVKKVYEYTIDQREKPDVFLRKYAYNFSKELDVSLIEQGIERLLGLHDFAAFCDKKIEKSTIRRIYDIQIEQQKNWIRFTFCGSGFLYHMVRILMGTLLLVGMGEIRVEDINSIVEGKERRRAGFLVPAQGLCLKEVIYEEESDEIHIMEC